MIVRALQPVVWLGAGLAAPLAVIVSAPAQTEPAPVILSAATPVVNSDFGNALATGSIPPGGADAGSILVVTGAPSTSDGRGHIEVHKLTDGAVSGQWQIAPPDLTSNERLGYAVATDGTTVVGGSPFAVLGEGRVRIFERTADGFALTQLLASPDPGSPQYFGHAVAIEGDWLAVGEPFDTLGGPTAAGAVHLYRKVEGAWQHSARVVAPARNMNDYFGYTLALRQGTLVIASRYARDGSAIEAGGVWILPLHADGSLGTVTRIQRPDPNTYDWFGAAVALDGDTLVVGACRDTVTQSILSEGTARIYRLIGGAWVHDRVLYSDTPSAFGRFGAAVAIEGARVIVGADGEDSPTNANAGFVYEFDGAADWSMTMRHSLDPDQPSQLFGISCALEQGALFAGAPDFMPVGGVTKQGVVAAVLPPSPCPADVNADGAVSGADLTELLNQWGGPGNADIDGSGAVNAADLSALLGSWGECAG